ncbi:hypothetical protein B0A52_02015 [Exophiala mesophila]|uniref:Transcription factor domain-containing protein n=1 Tax=Exophiala mesophila TaxID=212818 RepID=A0A438NEM3_EXOME|nr:hypothetical protein B0A52_02015 [Exophiala mesophila]
MTQGNTLALDIVTPKIWAERHASPTLALDTPAVRKRQLLKPPRKQRSKPVSDKHLVLKKLRDAQAQMRKFPTNGSLLDPFHTLPIKSNPQVVHAAQYYFQVWAPQHGRGFAFEGYSNPYLTLLWPFALQNDIYFEALIALCRAALLNSMGSPSHKDAMFVTHRNNVMNKLRHRLQCPDLCANDTTILVVATLGTIDYILGDHSSAGTHLSGMRQIIKIRGDLKSNTPWERLLQTNVAAYEALWSFVQASTVTPPAHPQSLETTSDTLQKTQLPIYMSHPFPQEACEMLAKLPRGFSDLGLTGILSLQIIRLLTIFTTLASSPSLTGLDKNEKSAIQPKIRKLIEDLHRLETLQVTEMERFLVHALVSYCFLLRHVLFNDLIDGFYESALKRITDVALAQKSRLHPSAEHKCYLWCYLIIGTTLQLAEVPPCDWPSVMPILLDCYTEGRVWKSLRAESAAFFWPASIENLAQNAFDQAMARKCQVGNHSTVQRSSHNTMAIRNVIS